MATEIQGLSPKAKEVLQRNAELRQRDSEFIKIGPGEKKTMQFNPEMIEQVEAEFNGKKSTRFRYTVIEEGSFERSLTLTKIRSIRRSTHIEKVYNCYCTP